MSKTNYKGFRDIYGLRDEEKGDLGIWENERARLWDLESERQRDRREF